MIICAENFFNSQMFTAHTIAAEEETAGNEAWRVGTERRNKPNFWTPTTANSSTWLKCTCDRQRSANFIAIDRNSNLAGATVRLEVSDDDFTTTTEIFNVVFPSVTAFETQLSEGAFAGNAYVRSFDLHTGLYWRLTIDAMGAGIKPEVVGLYLGKSHTFDRDATRPWDDETTVLDADVSRRTRTGSHRFVLGDTEYDQVRYHVRQLFQIENRATWIVPDPNNAERAYLAKSPIGSQGVSFPQDFGNRILQLDTIEHQPRPR